MILAVPPSEFLSSLKKKKNLFSATQSQVNCTGPFQSRLSLEGFEFHSLGSVLVAFAISALRCLQHLEGFGGGGNLVRLDSLYAMKTEAESLPWLPASASTRMVLQRAASDLLMACASRSASPEVRREREPARERDVSAKEEKEVVEVVVMVEGEETENKKKQKHRKKTTRKTTKNTKKKQKKNAIGVSTTQPSLHHHIGNRGARRRLRPVD